MRRRRFEDTSNGFDQWTHYFGRNAASKEQKHELQFLVISGYRALNSQHKFNQLGWFHKQLPLEIWMEKTQHNSCVEKWNWIWLVIMTNYIFSIVNPLKNRCEADGFIVISVLDSVE